MRKVWTVLFGLIVLALDWAALHDIIQGEADVWLEGVFLAASLSLFVVYLLRGRREAKLHEDA